MRLRILLFLAAVLTFARVSAAADDSPLLVHSPTLSKTQIVFVYGGYLWSVPREGGEARQLTTGGHETMPIFSPDGKWIAFTGQYDGNVDAFVMPAEGGSPRRLTWHPGPDIVRGWTPDSKRVLFDSAREAYADFVGSTPFLLKAAGLKFSRCGAVKRRRTRPTQSALRTSRI
jgi:tricorn protease